MKLNTFIESRKDEPLTRLFKLIRIENIRLVSIMIITMIAINFAWFDQKKTSPALVFFNANYHLANCCLAICKLSDQLHLL